MFNRINVALAALITSVTLCANIAGAVASVSKSPKTVVTEKRASDPASSPLEIKLVRHKIALVANKETLQDAASAKPGDVLEDVATYTNKTSRELVVPNATLPVPTNTELILSSVNPAPALASVDGINYFPLPLKTKVIEASGVVVEKPLAVSQYRFLRWLPGKLASRQSVAYSARFKVVDTETTIVKR